MQQMVEDLEVSRATVCRDIEMMRGQLNAPIVFDRRSGTYRLDEKGVAGPAYMVPGLWLSPAQAYAFLTLNNMLRQIAPDLLGPFLEPMRASLKSMLCDSEYPMWGLDRKIEIDMPPLPALDDRLFAELIDALLNEREVVFHFREGPTLYGIPLRLKIGTHRWLLRVRSEKGEVELDIATVVDIERLA
jgi:predicted DNA-binding transcriptional regulator YafY